MAVFEYKGLSEAGKPVTGMMEADSAKTLRANLRKNGVYLTDVLGQTAGTLKDGGARGKGAAARTGASQDVNVNLRKLARSRIGTDDIAITTRQLATLLAAGVPLVDSLAALVDQVEKERLKRVLSDVKQRVNEGSSLADALQNHVKIFGPLYVNMIRAGEHSGALDAVLTRLADFTEGQAKLQNKVIGTLMYPLVMMIVSAGILMLLMTVVVPKVIKVFDSMKATLPWTTRLLIFLSNALSNYWFIIFPVLFGSIFLFVRWTRTEKGKPVWDRWLLKMPIFGPIIRMLAVARFTRTLATLLKSGVPVLPAMDIVKNVVTNSVLADVVDKARDSIREGESIAGPLKRSGEFPPLVHHMIAVGERSGQLEDMLLSVAESYETQVDVRVGALTSLLEPLMIVMMGATIAFVAFSIMLPILQINSSIR